MEFVDKIKRGDPGNNGSVTDPDTIIKMQVAADADKPADPNTAPAPGSAPAAPAKP